jgi:hypothetical protein
VRWARERSEEGGASGAGGARDGAGARIERASGTGSSTRWEKASAASGMERSVRIGRTSMVKHCHSNKHLSISERLLGMKGAHDTKMIHVVQCIAICQYTYQKHTALPIPKTCTVVTKAVQEQLHAHISSFHGQGKGGVQSISRKNTHTRN